MSSMYVKKNYRFFQPFFLNVVVVFVLAARYDAIKVCENLGQFRNSLAFADTPVLHGGIKSLFESDAVNMSYASGSRVWVTLRTNEWRWIDGSYKLFLIIHRRRNWGGGGWRGGF